MLETSLSEPAVVLEFLSFWTHSLLNKVLDYLKGIERSFKLFLAFFLFIPEFWSTENYMFDLYKVINISISKHIRKKFHIAEVMFYFSFY